jgi:hypothetical protein
VLNCDDFGSNSCSLVIVASEVVVILNSDEVGELTKEMKAAALLVDIVLVLVTTGGAVSTKACIK